MMKATITAVKFDFTSEDGIKNIPSAEEQQKIISSVIGKVYEVEYEEEIADCISNDTGWLVESLDYDLTGGQDSYRFYVDQKCTIWYRTNFNIMADSQEHANQLAEKLFSNGGLQGIEFGLETIGETVQLWDTIQETGVEELFSAEGKTLASIGS